jgi:hypothetical protein
MCDSDSPTQCDHCKGATHVLEGWVYFKVTKILQSILVKLFFQDFNFKQISGTQYNGRIYFVLLGMCDSDSILIQCFIHRKERDTRAWRPCFIVTKMLQSTLWKPFFKILISNKYPVLIQRQRFPLLWQVCVTVTTHTMCYPLQRTRHTCLIVCFHSHSRYCSLSYETVFQDFNFKQISGNNITTGIFALRVCVTVIHPHNVLFIAKDATHVLEELCFKVTKIL